MYIYVSTDLFIFKGAIVFACSNPAVINQEKKENDMITGVVVEILDENFYPLPPQNALKNLYENHEYSGTSQIDLVPEQLLWHLRWRSILKNKNQKFILMELWPVI